MPTRILQPTMAVKVIKIRGAKKVQERGIRKKRIRKRKSLKNKSKVSCK